MTIDIAAKAKALVDTVLAEPANDHDIDLVQRQLGRAAWSPWGRDASAVGHLP